MAMFASVTGDTVSDIFAVLMVFPIALLAMQAGPPEIFAVLLMSLVIIVVISGSNLLKGLVMVLFGLWLAQIGTDPIDGVERFTFGIFERKSGIPVRPMLIGVFALPELVYAWPSSGAAFRRSGARRSSVRRSASRPASGRRWPP